MPDKFWRHRDSDQFVNETGNIGDNEAMMMVDGPVLDYGCGLGRLAPKFKVYTGADIAPHRVLKARELNPDREFRYVKDHTELGGKRYGSILLHSVLQHVPDREIKDTLDTLCRLSNRIIVVEHLGRVWRRRIRFSLRHSLHSRGHEEYVKLFGQRSFYKAAHNYVKNERYRAHISVMLFLRFGT